MPQNDVYVSAEIWSTQAPQVWQRLMVFSKISLHNFLRTSIMDATITMIRRHLAHKNPGTA